MKGATWRCSDEHTLLLGVGNCSDPRVAPVLARQLGMDVIAVQMRKVGFVKETQGESVLQSLLPHLDTCATLVGPKHAVVIPWLFEGRHARDNPLIGFLRGAASDEGVDGDEAEKVIGDLGEIGWIRRYVAGSGTEDEAVQGLKLADWLRRRGFEVLTVGGPPPAETDYRHLVKVVFAELERQAANVLATAPDRVIAYAGAPETQRTLRRVGIAVSTFDGRELESGDGGPHCLALPLERG